MSSLRSLKWRLLPQKYHSRLATLSASGISTNFQKTTKFSPPVWKATHADDATPAPLWIRSAHQRHAHFALCSTSLTPKACRRARSRMCESATNGLEDLLTPNSTLCELPVASSALPPCILDVRKATHSSRTMRTTKSFSGPLAPSTATSPFILTVRRRRTSLPLGRTTGLSRQRAAFGGTQTNLQTRSGGVSSRARRLIDLLPPGRKMLLMQTSYWRTKPFSAIGQGPQWS
ncbi:hypothetical protein BKA93DRAFT_800807 [Sparassis latifolia]